VRPERTESRSGRSPKSWTVARTVLASLGTLLLLIVVAETMAISYSTRIVGAASWRYEYVPYVGYLVLQSSPPDGSMGFTPTWGQAADGERVWMLGGSAVLGGNARPQPPAGVPPADLLRRSLPSAFAYEANEHGRSLSVLNFGQPGFNINQSRILFEEMLRRQPLPSVAVFYVGGTEVGLVAPYVGYPEMYERVRDRLERRVLPIRLRDELARESFKLPFFVNYLFNRRGKQLSPRADADRYNPFLALKVDNSEGSAASAVAAAIADSFAHNVRLLEGVCSEFGVRCFYYWQPLLCFKQTLTPWEARIMEGSPQNDYFCKRARQTRAAIEANPSLAGRDNFADLSTIFEEVSAPIFVDMTHIDEAPVTQQLGHRTVAKRLFSDIFPD
jgi:hypothetical protein